MSSNSAKFSSNLYVIQTFKVWDGRHPNPNQKLQETGYETVLWNILNLSRFTLNGNFLFRLANASPNLEIGEKILLKSPTSWHTDFSQIIETARSTDDGDFPAVILMFTSKLSIHAVRNTENEEFSEMILAPVLLCVTKKEIKHNIIFYSVITIRESYLFLKDIQKIEFEKDEELQRRRKEEARSTDSFIDNILKHSTLSMSEANPTVSAATPIVNPDEYVKSFL